jgi:hypothetical protein
MLSNIFLSLDKALQLFGNKKTQKGFLITIITAPLLKFFPTFPQEHFTLLFELLVQLVNIVGQIWLVIGVLHAWIKDQLVKFGYIPPSVLQRAEETGLPQVVYKPADPKV